MEASEPAAAEESQHPTRNFSQEVETRVVETATKVVNCQYVYSWHAEVSTVEELLEEYGLEWANNSIEFQDGQEGWPRLDQETNLNRIYRVRCLRNEKLQLKPTVPDSVKGLSAALQSADALPFYRLDIYSRGQRFPSFEEVVRRLTNEGDSGWKYSPLDQEVRREAQKHGLEAYALIKQADQDFKYQHLLTDACQMFAQSFVIFLVDEKNERWYALPYGQGGSLLRPFVDESFAIEVAKTCMKDVTREIETIRLQGNIRGVKVIYRTPQTVRGGKSTGEHVKRVKLYPREDGPLTLLPKRKAVHIGGCVKISGTLTWELSMKALMAMQGACKGFDEERYKNVMPFLDEVQHLQKYRERDLNKRLAVLLAALIWPEKAKAPSPRDLEEIFLYIPPEVHTVSTCTTRKNVLWSADQDGIHPRLDLLCQRIGVMLPSTTDLSNVMVLATAEIGKPIRMPLLDLFEVRMQVSSELSGLRGRTPTGKECLMKLSRRWIRFKTSFFERLRKEWYEEVRGKYALALAKFIIPWNRLLVEEELQNEEAEKEANEKQPDQKKRKTDAPAPPKPKRKYLEAAYNRLYLNEPQRDGWRCLLGDQIWAGSGIGSLELFDILAMDDKKNAYFIQVKRGWAGELRIAFEQLRMSRLLVEESYTHPKTWWGNLRAHCVISPPGKGMMQPPEKRVRGSVLQIWFDNLVSEKKNKKGKKTEKALPPWKIRAREVAKAMFLDGKTFAEEIRGYTRHYVLAFVEKPNEKKKESQSKKDEDAETQLPDQPFTLQPKEKGKEKEEEEDEDPAAGGGPKRSIYDHPYDYCTPIPVIGWNSLASDFEERGCNLRLYQIPYLEG